MPQKWNDVCALGSDRPTPVGEWTKPTSGSRASGSIYTGLSTPAVRRSTSFCRLNATQQRPSAFWPSLGRREPSSAAGHQHRRARRLSTGDRAAQSRGGSQGELPASTGAISQLAPFKKLAQTFRQYWDGIVSYFQCRITQGAIEAMNGIIQLAKRRARGFRNFVYLRVIAYWVAGQLKANLPSYLPT